MTVKDLGDCMVQHQAFLVARCPQAFPTSPTPLEGV